MVRTATPRLVPELMSLTTFRTMIGQADYHVTVEQGRLRVHVQETFPFERVADAHRLLDGGHLQGKLVLTV